MTTVRRHPLASSAVERRLVASIAALSRRSAWRPESASVAAKWRIRAGKETWQAYGFASMFFERGTRPGTVVSVEFTPVNAAQQVRACPWFVPIRRRLADFQSERAEHSPPRGERLFLRIRGDSPNVVLGTLEKVGATIEQRMPTRRARGLVPPNRTERLRAIAANVQAGGTAPWRVHGMTFAIGQAGRRWVTIHPALEGHTGRPGFSVMFQTDAQGDAVRARAAERELRAAGFRNPAEAPEVAWGKDPAPGARSCSS